MMPEKKAVFAKLSELLARHDEWTNGPMHNEYVLGCFKHKSGVEILCMAPFGTVIAKFPSGEGYCSMGVDRKRRRQYNKLRKAINKRNQRDALEGILKSISQI